MVTAVFGTPTRQIDAVVAGIEQSPPGALDSVARARSDVHDVVSAGMFGFWGVVVVSLSTGLFVFSVYSELWGVLSIGMLLTTYGVYLQNQH